MLILAIESSCDETSAAIVDMSDDTRKVLSNIVYTQIATHALYGGVVPEIASRAHCEAICCVVEAALEKASIKPDELDAVAVTNSPGLIGSLLVGVSFAKAFAYAHSLPLIPVDHIKAHAAAALLENPKLYGDYTALIVSGSHTSIYHVKDYTDFREIGASRDDAAGEAFDKVGRLLGLSYPGGAAMDKLAEGCETQKYSLKLPSPAIADDSYDFSFSGLKTAVINHVNSLRMKLSLASGEPLPEEHRKEIAGAFTASLTAGIVKKLTAALDRGDIAHTPLVLAGGVAANSHLRKALGDFAHRNGLKLYMPSLSLCGDNAAMVGAMAYYEYKRGVTAPLSLNAFASGDL